MTLPMAHNVRIIRVRPWDVSIGVESMMGHLVFGRYASQDSTPAQHKEGWMQRLLRNLLAHTPFRLR